MLSVVLASELSLSALSGAAVSVMGRLSETLMLSETVLSAQAVRTIGIISGKMRVSFIKYSLKISAAVVKKVEILLVVFS